VTAGHDIADRQQMPGCQHLAGCQALRALLTVRTEDWHFLRCALFCVLEELPRLYAAGDESGLGRQICWEAANQFHSRFLKVNFASKKQDLGFALMNQLSVVEKRFPRNQPDIASDFFALRKAFSGAKWLFTEGRNSLNPLSHCDIAWAAALATYAHTQRPRGGGAAVAHENCWFDGKEYRPYSTDGTRRTFTPEQRLLSSDDPDIWRPLA